jgi:E3 ubiquitin-protein ligase ZNF598
MRDHFKSEHFLCEEEECADEQFTSVFRSEIDLRAHVATVHAKGLSRIAARQARTIDLDFSYGPRGVRGQESSRGGGRSRGHDTQRDFDRIQEQPVVQQPQTPIDTKNKEQFPSLGPTGNGGTTVQLANTVRHAVYGSAGLARTKENFPSLGGNLAENPKSNQQQPSTSGKQFKMATASSLLKGSSAPKSKGKSNQAPSSGGIKTNSASDFPALSQNNASSAASMLFKAPIVPAQSRPVASSNKPSSASAAPKKGDFPTLSQTSSKKNRKNELLMEDMIEPGASVGKNLISSKHRGLVDDYVSMAAQVTKVQTVQQKEVEPALLNAQPQYVPKLSSNDNFPSLGSASAGSLNPPQWMTVKATGNQKNPPKQEAPKKDKKEARKVNVMPPNGYRKVDDNIKTNNGNVKQKSKQNNGNKENKNENVVLTNLPSPPPGLTPTPKKLPPGFNISQPIEYSYHPPTNMSKRNQALVGEFQKALKTSETMQEFKLVSQMFRDGSYHPKGYYETCQHVLGSNFDSIFPELLALLPDIEKQQVSSQISSDSIMNFN